MIISNVLTTHFVFVTDPDRDAAAWWAHTHTPSCRQSVGEVCFIPASLTCSSWHASCIQL
jgi:hypothetical protein